MNATIGGLADGDLLELHWTHFYVKKPGVMTPERTITKLDKVGVEQIEDAAVREKVSQAISG